MDKKPYIIILLLATLLGSWNLNVSRAQQDLVAVAEYRVEFDGYLVFPVNSSLVGCGSGLLVAVAAPEGLVVRVAYSESGGYGELNMTTHANVTVYRVGLDGVVGAEPACNTTLVIESRFRILPGGVAVGDGGATLAPVFVAAPMAGWRVSYPIVYPGVLGADLGSEEAVDSVASTLREALAEAGLDRLVVVRRGERPTVLVFEALSLGSTRAVNLTGYAVTIAPPPGREYRVGNTTFSPVETALPGEPNETLMIVGEGMLAARLHGIYYIAYYDGGSILAATLRDLAAARTSVVDILYHWQTGVLLEANLSLIHASTLLQTLALHKATNQTYPAKVNGVPLTLVAPARSPAAAAQLLDPDAAPAVAAALVPVQARMMASNVTIEAGEPAVAQAEPSPLPKLAVAAAAAAALAVLGYALARGRGGGV